LFVIPAGDLRYPGRHGASSRTQIPCGKDKQQGKKGKKKRESPVHPEVDGRQLLPTDL
jgi:hypothetical protein